MKKSLMKHLLFFFTLLSVGAPSLLFLSGEAPAQYNPAQYNPAQDNPACPVAQPFALLRVEAQAVAADSLRVTVMDEEGQPVCQQAFATSENRSSSGGKSSGGKSSGGKSSGGKSSGGKSSGGESPVLWLTLGGARGEALLVEDLDGGRYPGGRVRLLLSGAGDSSTSPVRIAKYTAANR